MIGVALIALGTAVIVLSALLWRTLAAAEAERSRLQRMAFAEDKSERIAALIPTPPRPKAASSSERPVKPIGI